MRAAFTRQYLFPAIMGAALAALIGLWGVYETLGYFQRAARARAQRFESAAALIATALEGQTFSPSNARELSARLKTLIAAAGLRYGAIEDADRTIAESGPTPLPLVARHARHGQERVDGWAVWERPLNAARGNDGPPGLTLVIADDARARNAASSDPAGELIVVFLIVGSFGAASLVLAWSISARNQELKARLKANEERREQVEELSLAASGLAHETKNPLGIIRGLAQRIADPETSQEKARAMAVEIMEEADITTARLGDFMRYANTRDPQPVPIPVRDVFDKVRSPLADEFQSAGVQLVIDAPENPVLIADPEMLPQALLNLLLNSLRATPSGGKVILRVARSGRETVELSVIDTGHGIAPEILSKLFKPYALKKAKGYGIGLAIVKKFIDKSGWTIEARSKLNVGTEVTIGGVELGPDA